MKIVQLLLLAAAFVGAAAWAFFRPGWDSITAMLGAAAALTAASIFWGHRLVRQQSASQSQTVGRSGVGIQAGRDVSIGAIRSERD